MEERKLLRLGYIGAILAALCCFTPVLVIALGAAGLSAIVGGLDYLLFPLLFACLGVIGYALYLRSGSAGPSPRNTIMLLVLVFSALLFGFQFRFAIPLSLVAVALLVAYAVYLRKIGDQSAA